MEYNIETDGDIVGINLSGNLVRSSGEELKGEVTEMVAKGLRYLLIDMSNVHFIDSYGITVCMAFYKMIENRGGHIVFVKPSKIVEKVFHITQAEQKFHIVSNRDEGIRAINERIQTAAGGK